MDELRLSPAKAVILSDFLFSSFFLLSASFYGSSHAALPLADARSTTSISFRMRTSRPEALIVLAAGRMDYCLVMMQGGAIKVSEC